MKNKKHIFNKSLSKNHSTGT